MRRTNLLLALVAMGSVGLAHSAQAHKVKDAMCQTVPFTFQVEGLWERTTQATSAPSARWEKAVSPAPPAKSKQGVNVQRATIVIDGGYSPATVSVKARRPVQLTFIRKETSGCGDVLQFPGLGVKRTLKPGEKSVISFTPTKPGTIPFTCGMSMYRGQVVVK
jgi:Cupredoxin-like domain